MTSDCVIVPRREVKVSKVVQSKISNWQHWQCHWQRPITLIVNVCDARLCVGRWSFGHPAATPYLYQPSGASQLFRWIIFSEPHIFGNFVFFPDISFLFSARPSVMWLMMTDCCHVVYCVLDSAHILLNLSLSWFLFNGQKFVEGFRKKDSFLQGSNFLKQILPMICNMTLCFDISLGKPSGRGWEEVRSKNANILKWSEVESESNQKMFFRKHALEKRFWYPVHLWLGCKKQGMKWSSLTNDFSQFSTKIYQTLKDNV